MWLIIPKYKENQRKKQNLSCGLDFFFGCFIMRTNKEKEMCTCIIGY